MDLLRIDRFRFVGLKNIHLAREKTPLEDLDLLFTLYYSEAWSHQVWTKEVNIYQEGSDAFRLVGVATSTVDRSIKGLTLGQAHRHLSSESHAETEMTREQFFAYLDALAKGVAGTLT